MKKTITWLLVLSLLLGLTACSAASVEPTTEPTVPSAPSAEPTETQAPTEPVTAPSTEPVTEPVTEPTEPVAPVPVTLKVVAREAESVWLERQLAAFETSYPQYDITWELTLLGTWDPLAEHVWNAPDPTADIYLIRSTELTMMIDEKLISTIGKDAQRLLADQLPQAAWDSVRFFKGNRTYGLPLSCSYAQVVIYRKSVFSSEDLVSIEALLNNGKITFGIWTAYYASMFFYANGGSIGGPGVYDQKYGVCFGGPEGRAAAAKLAELASHPNLCTNGYTYWQDFLSGTVDAVVTDSNSYAEALRVFGDDVGIAPLPGTILNGTLKPLKDAIDFRMVCTGTRQENKGLATMLAVHLSSPTSQADRYTETGEAPLARSLMDDPAVAADPVASTVMRQVFDQSVPYRDTTEVAPTFWGKMDSLAYQIVLQKKTPTQAADLLDRIFPTPTVIEEEPTPTLPSTTDREQVVMRVWSEDRDWAQQMMAQFEALHPEYAFYWLYEEEGTYGLPQRLAAYQDLDPAVDVMVYLRSDLDELLALDALAPVTGSVSSGVPQVLTDAVTHSDGKRYGLPLSAQGDVLFYNKDLYAPEDLGSLETLMAKGRVSYSLSDSNTSLALFLANGCTVYGPKGNDFSAGVQLGGERGHEVVLRLTELLNDPALGDRYLSRNRMDVEDMATGTVGAWIGSYSMYRQFLSVMGPDKLGVAALPTLRIGARDVPIQTTVDPLCVGVGRDSEHPALAQELAAFLASRESQLLRYSLCGSLPADTALKNDPAVAQYPHRVTSMEMVERGCYYPLSFQGTPEYLTSLSDLLIEIVNGKVTKDDCRERWDQYLKNIQ